METLRYLLNEISLCYNIVSSGKSFLLHYKKNGLVNIENKEQEDPAIKTSVLFQDLDFNLNKALYSRIAQYILPYLKLIDLILSNYEKKMARVYINPQGFRSCSLGTELCLVNTELFTVLFLLDFLTFALRF